MRKITISFFISFIVMIVLSGCVTISPTDKLSSALGSSVIKKNNKSNSDTESGDKSKKDFQDTLNKRNICNPDLGILGGIGLPVDTMNLKDLIKPLDRPLTQDLVKNLLALRVGIVDSNYPNNGLNLAASEFRVWFWNPIGFLSAIDELSKSLLENDHDSRDELAKRLHSYLKIYLDGEFVLRDGTTISKPGGNITNKRITKKVDGKEVEETFLSTSLEIGTVTGLTTVILEAIFDHCLDTPVYAFRNNKVMYQPYYKPTGEIIIDKEGENINEGEIIRVNKGEIIKDKEGNIIKAKEGEVIKIVEGELMKDEDGELIKVRDGELVKAKEGEVLKIKKGELIKFKKVTELLYAQKKVDDFFFDRDNYNRPTAAVAKDINPISYKEVNKEFEENIQAIRRISNFAATTTKAAVGASFKSIGGLGASFGGFFKFSIGDNDAINQIVETAASVAARRNTEYMLYKLMNDNEKEYMCGENTDCFTTVSKLLKIWKN